MILRILTDNNYLDVELKEQIDTEKLIEAIDNSSTIMVDTKQDTTFFINTINVVAIEIINRPIYINRAMNLQRPRKGKNHVRGGKEK